MKRSFIISAGMALALSAMPLFTAQAKVSQERLEQIMSAWPDDIRSNAERLVAAYGLPDRVTSTVLVWDVPNTAQQQAMLRTAGERGQTAEAGAELISLKGN